MRALFLAGLLASPVAAQFPGEIVGRVLDGAHGGGVASASVGLAGVTATTDPDGSFHLRGLEPGRHELVVERLGYLTARRSVEVRNGQRGSLTVLLEPAPVDLEHLVASVSGAVPTGGVRLEAARFPVSASSAGDLVRALPGVLVTRRGPGAAETPSIRGSSPDAVLVLLDGVPLNDPVTGEADLSTVPAAALARVTVLPGARAARWGPRAAAGVILLERRGRGGQAPTATVTTGSLVRRSLALAAAAPVGPLRVGGSAGAERADGRFSFTIPVELGGGGGERVNADLAREHAALEAGTRVLGGDLVGRAGVSRLRRGLPGRSYLPSESGRQRESRADASIAWRGGPETSRLDARAHLARRSVRYLDPAPPAGLPFDETTRVTEAGLALEALSSAPPGPLSTLTIGLDLVGQRVRGGGLDRTAPSGRADVGAHGAIELPLGGGPAAPALGAALGVWRAGPEGTWKATHELVLEAPLGALSLHASHRSAYSPPALADQYFSEAVGVRPNPDLRGERVPGEVEMGATLRGGGAGWEGRATLAAYRGDVQGMIVWAPDYRFVWSPTNVDVLRRGVEASAEVRVPLARGQLVLGGAWTHARTTYDRGADRSVQVAYRPRDLGSLGGRWSDAVWEVELEGRFTGRRNPFPSPVNALPGFWTTDVGVARVLSLGGWRLTPSLRVERLLDNDDALVFGFPEPGRTVALTLVAARGGGR